MYILCVPLYVVSFPLYSLYFPCRATQLMNGSKSWLVWRVGQSLAVIPPRLRRYSKAVTKGAILAVTIITNAEKRENINSRVPDDKGGREKGKMTRQKDYGISCQTDEWWWAACSPPGREEIALVSRYTQQYIFISVRFNIIVTEYWLLCALGTKLWSETLRIETWKRLRKKCCLIINNNIYFTLYICLYIHFFILFA